MSEQKPAQQTVTSTKPPRSPVERGIVWGVIAIGLIVIGIESSSHLAHGAAFSTLQTRMKETSDKDSGLTQKDIDKVLSGKTPESQKLNGMETAISAARVDIYTYKGLLRNREIYVYYGVAGKGKGQEAEVLVVGLTKVETAAQAEAKLPKPDPNAKAPATPMGMSGMAGGGAGGTGGRGGPGAEGRGGRGTGGGRPAAEGDKTKSDEAKPDATDRDKKPAEDKSDAEKKPDADKKLDEAKPAEAEKKTDAEPKKE